MGLGLIGGSLAAALRGFEDYAVVGVARRQETLDYAREQDVYKRQHLEQSAPHMVFICFLLSELQCANSSRVPSIGPALELSLIHI